MEFLGKIVLKILELTQNFLRFLQVVFLLFAIAIIVYWVTAQIPTPAFQGLTNALGVIISPFVTIVEFFYTFTTNYNGQTINLTPLITAGVLFAFAYAFEYAVIAVNLASAKTFEIIDDLSFKIEENEKQYILEQIKKEVLEHKYLHVMIKFNQAASEINEITEEASKKEIAVKLKSVINQAAKFNCYNTKKVGKGFTYILSFKTKADLISYLYLVKKQLIEINLHTKLLGLIINYKGLIDCSKTEESQRVEEFTTKVIKSCNRNEIMLSKMAKEFLEYDKTESLDFELIGKGFYTYEDDSIELFGIKLFKDENEISEIGNYGYMKTKDDFRV